MIEVKLECKNVSCEKIANRLSKFRGTFPFGYKVWVYKDRVFAYFKVKSTRTHQKIELTFQQIHKVWT